MTDQLKKSFRAIVKNNRLCAAAALAAGIFGAAAMLFKFHGLYIGCQVFTLVFSVILMLCAEKPRSLQFFTGVLFLFLALLCFFRFAPRAADCAAALYLLLCGALLWKNFDKKQMRDRFFRSAAAVEMITGLVFLHHLIFSSLAAMNEVCAAALIGSAAVSAAQLPERR